MLTRAFMCVLVLKCSHTHQVTWTVKAGEDGPYVDRILKRKQAVKALMEKRPWWDLADDPYFDPAEDDEYDCEYSEAHYAKLDMDWVTPAISSTVFPLSFKRKWG